MTHIHVTIEKIINGGFGLGRLDSGQIVLCRHVLPEEKVIVTTERKKKNHLFGTLSQILSPHVSRIEPPCQYYTRCGGCNLQHCDYATQLELKQGIITELLTRQGLQCEGILRSILPSPDEFGYRQRIRLQVDNTGRMGFHRSESHDLIEVEGCLLAGMELNHVLTELRLHKDTSPLLRLATEVELASHSADGGVIATFTLPRKPRPADLQRAQRLAEDIPMLTHCCYRGDNFPLSTATRSGQKKTSVNFSVEYQGLKKIDQPVKFCWEIGGFCQVNLSQNRHLIETVIGFCNPTSDDRILDLYCGMGNFGVPLAHLCKELLGFEGQGAAIRAGKQNTEHAGLTNIILKKSPVEKACRELALQGEKFDTTVIDPPRAGIPGLIDDLVSITRSKLVYISCDPATLCRDLKDLQAKGFFISALQPLDMFPQTHHIETVVLLERQK